MNNNSTANYLDSNQNPESHWYLIHIDSIIFFFIWLAYAIASFVAIVVSSSGWGALVMMFYGFLFYGVISLVTLITIVNKRIAHKHRITIDIRILVIMIFVQFLSLTGITGDCGDQMCDLPTNFGYRIANLFASNSVVFSSLFTSVTTIIGPVTLLGYMVILFSFLANSLFNKLVYKTVVITLIAVIVIGAIFSLTAAPTIFDNLKLTTALDSMDANSCASISGYDEKRSCYIKIAKETRDYTICDNIPMIKHPKYNYYSLSDIRDSCYMATVDFIKPIYEVCNRVTQISIKNYCFLRIADEKACESIVDGYDNSKDRCYKDLGVESQSSKYCEKIISNEWKKSCYDNMQPNNSSLPSGQ